MIFENLQRYKNRRGLQLKELVQLLSRKLLCDQGVSTLNCAIFGPKANRHKK